MILDTHTELNDAKSNKYKRHFIIFFFCFPYHKTCVQSRGKQKINYFFLARNNRKFYYDIKTAKTNSRD